MVIKNSNKKLFISSCFSGATGTHMPQWWECKLVVILENWGFLKS